MHPDKGGSDALFQRLTKIFRILSDAELRNVYDAYGEDAVDQHERNSETALELQETAFVAEDCVPEGCQWRPLKDGEGVTPGSTVKMDMSTGESFVLEPLLDGESDCYAWRKLRPGEAISAGNTVKMDMSTGENFVLEFRTEDPDICDDVVETPAPTGFCWSEDASPPREIGTRAGQELPQFHGDSPDPRDL